MTPTAIDPDIKVRMRDSIFGVDEQQSIHPEWLEMRRYGARQHEEEIIRLTKEYAQTSRRHLLARVSNLAHELLNYES